MASETRKRVSRSLSGDVDSETELFDEGGQNDGHSSLPGKPGRKKNPNSQAARRDQNRIAQREFRLRKQQRIRDLEARVEILSGSKDETYGQMRDIITELIQENQTLRNMVRGLSGFIGEGAGGVLPRMGWTMKDFEAFINKADTDTAFEAFAKRKRATQNSSALSSPTGGGASAGASGDKRGDDGSASRKRARTSASRNGAFDGAGGSDVNFSPSGSFGSPFAGTDVGLYSNMRPPAGFPPNFLGGLGPTDHGAPQFMGPGGASPATGLAYGSGPVNGREAFPGAFPAAPSSGSPQTAGGASLQGLSFLGGTTSTTSPSQSEPTPGSLEDDVLDDPKAQEARKLVGYHLENYRRNTAYCLPPSLRPTLVQRTVEHEHIIDGIPHPELRNRMILLRGRFDLVECIHDYLTSTVIHGDDVLGHANWEIQESWLKKYGYLVDPTTLSLTNRWRKERGEPEILLSDISPSEQLPGLGQS